MTSQYLDGEIEEDSASVRQQRFSARSGAKAQQSKIERTALLRAADSALAGDMDSLPVGQVVQVYSLYCDVEWQATTYLCVVRKTLSKLSDTYIVVGDHVRIRPIEELDEKGRPEAVVEQVLPRSTILTRSDSFKAIEQHPIVANASQMLIVASLHEPEVKWGLIDRMLIAAQAGGLRPILCLNKMDLARQQDEEFQKAHLALEHYASMGTLTLQTSVPTERGVEELRQLLHGQTTVLAGHSGVGKSSLIHAVEPALSIRIAAISGYTGKGRHTTTSARRYALPAGGYVIDTPGVKLFGLWNVTRESLIEFFPDIQGESPLAWRVESYERILESLPEAEHGAA